MLLPFHINGLLEFEAGVGRYLDFEGTLYNLADRDVEEVLNELRALKEAEIPVQAEKQFKRVLIRKNAKLEPPKVQVNKAPREVRAKVRRMNADLSVLFLARVQEMLDEEDAIIALLT